MRPFRNASLLLAASVVAAALGCTSSPTEPGSTPVTPKPPVPVTTYSVEVTANPPSIVSGGTGSSTVTVQVHRADNGQPVPDGTQVTLTTTLGNFNSATGGPQTVPLQLVNGRASAVLFAGSDVGTAAVSASFGGSTGAANVQIGPPATFFVSSVSPNLGDSAGGQQVTVLGGGFGQPVRVTFGGAAATVKSVSPTQIVVVTPSAAAAGAPIVVGQTASVSVMVTNHVNQVNQQSDSIDKGFTYAVGGGGGGQPSVFAVSPASGTNEGGTRVTITGTGFQSPLQVFFGTGSSASTFNGVEATVVSVTPTQIVAITPAAHGFGQNLTNQLVDVLIKETSSGFSGIGSQQFKYGSKVTITSMSTGSGSYLGGTRLTIFGSGFEGPAAVSFTFTNPNVSVAQTVLAVSGTEIQIITSPAPLPTTCPKNGLISSSSVSEVNINTGDGATAPIGFNFELPTPTITNLTPPHGMANDIIMINGQNFNPLSMSVTFGAASGGTSAQITSGSSTVLNVRVPTQPASFFTTTACGSGGTIPVSTPITINVTDNSTGCTSSFTNGFLMDPTLPMCTGQTPQTRPTASFTATQLDGHTYQFVDKSMATTTGATVNGWAWNFGDNTTSIQQNPMHSYSGPFPRNVTVTLTVTDSNGLMSSQAAMVIAVPGP
jgi:hypothetical protein